MISIAMATYNGEKYLRKQLDSIYNQTFKDFELVVCDDASTDSTVSILKEYHGQYGLKYYINEKNLGYIKNFEKAVSLCSGEYIALSDQDDIWVPEKLEILLKEIGSYSLICSDADLINETGDVFFYSFRKYDNIYIPKEDKQFNNLFYSNFVTGCTCLFKKEILKEAFPFPDNIPHDWWLAIHASLNQKIKYLYLSLVQYRQHSGNAIGSVRNNKIKNTIKLNRKEKIFKEINSKILLITKVKDLLLIENECVINLSNAVNDLVKFKISISKGFFHWRAFLIAFKYRNLIYPKQGIKKYLFIISKLIV